MTRTTVSTDRGTITVHIPLTFRKRGGRKRVVTPVRDDGEAALPTRADPALVKALARAFRYQRLLDEGRYASISEMAEGERVERGYLGGLLRLMLLAPHLMEAILDGRQSEALLRLLKPFPLGWAEQRAALGDLQGPCPAEVTSDPVGVPEPTGCGDYAT